MERLAQGLFAADFDLGKLLVAPAKRQVKFAPLEVAVGGYDLYREGESGGEMECCSQDVVAVDDLTQRLPQPRGVEVALNA
jgi:hypothetical protein